MLLGRAIIGPEFARPFDKTKLLASYYGWTMAQSMDEFVEGLRTSVTGWKVDVARFEAQEADELAALVARWIAEAEKLITTYESQNA